MGFWAGFAQGYSDEKDRIEARKQYQDALDLKKKDMVLQIAQLRAELGMTKDKEGGSTSVYAASLAQMGVDPEKIAALAEKGGVGALKTVSEQVRSNYDPKNPYTPEQLNSFVDNTVTAVAGGGSVDMTDLLGSAGISLTPLEQDYFSALTTTPETSTTLTPLPPATPASMDDAKQAIDIANQMTGDALLEEMDNLQTQMADPNLTTEESSALATQYNTYKSAKEQFDNGVVNPAVSLVGKDVMATITAGNPTLAASPIIKAYGAPAQTQEQAPAAPTQTQSYTESGLSFASPEEAQAAIDAGELQPYSYFTIGGVKQQYPMMGG